MDLQRASGSRQIQRELLSPVTLYVCVLVDHGNLYLSWSKRCLLLWRHICWFPHQKILLNIPLQTRHAQTKRQKCWPTHTHTHTHTCLERRRGTIRASLNFLRISEVFVIHRVARSQDYRNQRICAISRSAANRKYRTEKKRDGTQTSVTPESRPFQGNSTRNFCWCTPVHVLNHTSEEITIFAPKSFGQLNMRCCTILHGLTLFLRPRTSLLLTRTTVRRV